MQKPHLDVFAVEIAIEIEQMQLEDALRRACAIVGRTRGSLLRGHFFPLEHSLRRINAVGRKLLAVRAQVRGRKSETAPEMLARLHRPENRVFAPEHRAGGREIPRLHGLPNGRAADDVSIRRRPAATPTTSNPCCAPSSFSSARLPARFFPNDHSWPTQISRSGRAAATNCFDEICRRRARPTRDRNLRPADATTPRSRMSAILCCVAVSRRGLSCGRRNFAGCGSKVTTTARPARCRGVPRRGRDDRLMAEVDAVENPDREKTGPGICAQFGNRPQNAA